MRPMLATRTTAVPPGEQWTHEVKWDGVRILIDSTAAGSRLYSRNGNDATTAWPELSRSPLGSRDVLLDGEVIGLNELGVPDFRVLQERMHVRSATAAARLAGVVPATYMAFDLLRLDGHDLTHEPLEKRRELLLGLDLAATAWQVPAAYDDGAMLFRATLEQGLEGVVSKRRGSRYRFGERTPDWLKLAHRHRDSYVVGGWRPLVGSGNRLGALLVGTPGPDGLLYRGRVGSGLSGRTSAALAELLAPLTRADSPFADEVPKVDTVGTTWVEPRIVVDVDTHGTARGRLRQPSYRGVRTDLAPEDL